MRFRSDVNGYVTGLRFYKGAANIGTHVGHLWTNAGVLIEEATFTGETSSGWQTVTLSTPVAITANTTYVASYHSSSGFYADTLSYFTSVFDNPPLHGLADGADGPNGIYRYSAGTAFPTDTHLSSNYWVDVVFNTSIPPDTTPPTLTSVLPTPGASGVAITTAVTAIFSESLNAATINTSTFFLRDNNNVLVPATVRYDNPTRKAVLSPSSSLAFLTTYTATLKGGASGIKDPTGNALVTDSSWSFTTSSPPPPPPDEGPGGPILVIASVANPFGRYYAEILRTEGFNEFTVTDISTVTPAMLASYDLVILGEMSLTAPQVNMLSNWASGGRSLIAMRPDKQLAGLLGLTDANATLANKYLLVNTSSAPGTGIVSQTMQFHGAADLYSLSGATSVATLYSDSTTATANPAVTLRARPGGGYAAAFTYDLARSVVYTRQGNPAWSGQERDGINPIRSDDLFYGAAASDPQPDWVDLNKVAIPQADEQQRLLANLILYVSRARKPFPRFWYFPRGLKATVVMTGDEHGCCPGTRTRFNIYQTQSPPGCSVDNWECVRASSYAYNGGDATDAEAAAWTAAGFEFGVHLTSLCDNWTPTSLDAAFTAQLASFSAQYPSAPLQDSNRTHCIAYSDWAGEPKVELAHGIRLDTNYYYYPPAWVADRPGVFTGSGMPMRFADLDGTIIDCYQVATQMTDESGQSYPFTPDTLLDRALGSEGYYGAFCANMHTDQGSHPGSDAIVASAQARGVPIVSGRQLLKWLDGRNGSSFGGLTFDGHTLAFTISVGNQANNLQAMMPVTWGAATLTGITRNGIAVSYSTQVIKGINYVFFGAQAGAYAASYALACSQTAAADFNLDCAVDNLDFAIFKSCATRSATPYNPSGLPQGCALAPDASGKIAADFDRDGDVDMSDFAVFQRCFSGLSIAADPNCSH